MLAAFSGSVTDSDGRIAAVYPRRQIVCPMFACVTVGSIEPGVQRRSGSENGPDPRVRHECAGGCGWTTSELAMLTTRTAAARCGEIRGRLTNRRCTVRPRGATLRTRCVVVNVGRAWEMAAPPGDPPAQPAAPTAVAAMNAMTTADVPAILRLFADACTSARPYRPRLRSRAAGGHPSPRGSRPPAAAPTGGCPAVQILSVRRCGADIGQTHRRDSRSAPAHP